MAYSDSFPAVSPQWQCNFAANGGRLEPRMNYSRASSANVWDGSKHLSSENLMPYSNNVSAAAWTKARMTVESVDNTAPGGGSDASLILETVDNGTHSWYESYNCVSGESYTHTMFAKANGRTLVKMMMYSTSNVCQVEFDLSALTSSVVSGSATSHSIVDVGGSWRKLSFTAVANGTGTGYHQNYVGDGSSYSYAGDVTKGVYVWGHQVSSTGETVLNETSGSIHRQYASSLVSKANNAARFEVGTDGQSEGILIESQSSNLAPYAKNGFDASNAFQWGTSQVVPTENAAVAPSGNLEATLIAENSGTGQHNLSKNIFASAAAHTFSFYVKDAGVGNIGVRLIGPTNIGRSFNLTDNSTGAFYDAPTSYGIEDVGNGWKRVHITATLTAATWSFYIYAFRGAGSVSYSGDGYSGFLFYGAQLEANSSASSWVDTGTGGSTATRAADSLSVALSDVGYTGGPLTVVSETEGGQGNYPTSFNLNDGTSSNQLSVYRGSANATTATNRVFYVKSDGNVQVESSMTSSSTAGKLAVSLDTNDAAATASGNAVTTDTSVTLPSGLSQLIIGATWTGTTKHLNGHCKRIAIFSEALSDTNLISLTS